MPDACIHHWTVTSPCPLCQTTEIDRLTRERDEARAERDELRGERFDRTHTVYQERDRLRALLRKAIAIIARKAQEYPGVTIAEVRELEDGLEGLGVAEIVGIADVSRLVAGRDRLLDLLRRCEIETEPVAGLPAALRAEIAETLHAFGR